MSDDLFYFTATYFRLKSASSYCRIIPVLSFSCQTIVSLQPGSQCFMDELKQQWAYTTQMLQKQHQFIIISYGWTTEWAHRAQVQGPQESVGPWLESWIKWQQTHKTITNVITELFLCLSEFCSTCKMMTNVLHHFQSVEEGGWLISVHEFTIVTESSKLHTIRRTTPL